MRSSIVEIKKDKLPAPNCVANCRAHVCKASFPSCVFFAIVITFDLSRANFLCPSKVSGLRTCGHCWLHWKEHYFNVPTVGGFLNWMKETLQRVPFDGACLLTLVSATNKSHSGVKIVEYIIVSQGNIRHKRLIINRSHFLEPSRRQCATSIDCGARGRQLP